MSTLHARRPHRCTVVNVSSKGMPSAVSWVSTAARSAPASMSAARIMSPEAPEKQSR